MSENILYWSSRTITAKDGEARICISHIRLLILRVMYTHRSKELEVYLLENKDMYHRSIVEKGTMVLRNSRR